MIHRAAPLSRLFAILIVITTWFALGLQFYILARNAPASGLSVSQVTGRFFSYFTILTNLLVAVSLSLSLFTRGAAHRFFSRFHVQTAIAVYIFIVGLGYNLLLRHLWRPQGLQWLADELLHDMVPVLYIVYWSFFLPIKRLPGIHIFSWLIYPFLYASYALLRGALDGFYAYPFIDVNRMGLSSVLLNIGALLVVFIVICAVFIFITRLVTKKIKPGQTTSRQTDR